MNAAEIIALDFFFANVGYVTELAALGAGAVTAKIWDEQAQTMTEFDYSGLAAVAAQNWAGFEAAVQEHFGIDPTLNDDLMAAKVETVTLAGVDFQVGGWY